MKTKTYYLSLLLLLLFIKASSQNCNDDTYTGEGTYYEGVDGGSSGNCSLPVTAGDYLHCALNNINYDGSSACGACIEVTGPRGSVILKVVDRCPECASGDVDMTEEAFAMIAPVIDGRVPISWNFVPCETTSNNETIKINFKEGSSQYWTAIQFRNIKHAVTSMEYQLPDNSWKNVDRALFNFFIETSGIPSPMNLRATSILGETLVFENIPIDLNEDYDTQLQFSTPVACEEILSVEDTAVSSALLYPNPTSEILHIKNNSEQWILSDSTGKIINKGTANIIQMSTLTKGLYFVSLKGKRTEKIIKR